MSLADLEDRDDSEVAEDNLSRRPAFRSDSLADLHRPAFRSASAITPLTEARTAQTKAASVMIPAIYATADAATKLRFGHLCITANISASQSD